MRGWRNWHTRTFEGRVVLTLRVQVSFLAPKIGKLRQEVCRFSFAFYFLLTVCYTGKKNGDDTAKEFLFHFQLGTG